MAGGLSEQMAMVSEGEPVRIRRAWLVGGTALALALAILASGVHREMSLEAIIAHRFMLKDIVAENGFVAALGYVMVYTAMVALSVPGAFLVTIAGGFLFGWLLGAALTAVAATAGATLVFLAARSTLGEALRARAGPALQKLSEGFRADAFHYLLFLRLVPLFPFWLVNLAPAVLGIPLRTFVIGTLLGILPGTIAFSVAGAGLDSVITAQMQANPGCVPGQDCMSAIDPASLVTPEILCAFAALGLLALVPVAIKAWRGRAA